MPANIYVGDQPTTVSAEVGPGEAELSVSQLDSLVAVNDEAPVYLFSTAYNFVWQGQTLSFRPGIPYQIDSALLSALLVQAAPIVAA